MEDFGVEGHGLVGGLGRGEGEGGQEGGGEGEGETHGCVFFWEWLFISVGYEKGCFFSWFGLVLRGGREAGRCSSVVGAGLCFTSERPLFALAVAQHIAYIRARLSIHARSRCLTPCQELMSERNTIGPDTLRNRAVNFLARACTACVPTTQQYPPDGPVTPKKPAHYRVLLVPLGTLPFSPGPRRIHISINAMRPYSGGRRGKEYRVP